MTQQEKSAGRQSIKSLISERRAFRGQWDTRTPEEFSAEKFSQLRNERERIEYYCRTGFIPEEKDLQTWYRKTPFEEMQGLIVVEVPRYVSPRTVIDSCRRTDYKGSVKIDSVALDRWSERTKNFFDRNEPCDAFYLEDHTVLDRKKVYIGKQFGAYSIVGRIAYECPVGIVVAVKRGSVTVEVENMPEDHPKVINAGIDEAIRPAALLGLRVEVESEGFIRLKGIKK